MILAVCADKGSPGVTTLATALGVCWPQERLLLEADPSGGDLAFRARTTDGQFLPAEPGLVSLAAVARTGLRSREIPTFAQPTSWGVPVIAGPPGANACQPLRALWPAVADVAAGWSGVAIADLGRFQQGHAAAAVARAATTVIVLSRVGVEDLYHLRERVNELAHALGDPGHPHPLAVVLAAPRKQADDAVRQVTHVLQAGGSPIPVLGCVATDAQGAASLRSGELPRRRSDLLASTSDLVIALLARWPELGAETGSLPRLPSPVAGPASKTAGGPR